MRILTTRHLPLALLTATFIVAAPAAGAHEVRYEPHAYYEPSYRVPRHRAPLPHWLRHNYSFVRWYDLNHYHYRAGISWKRLYRYYERDHRYHRNYKARKKAERHDRRGHGRKYKRHH